MSVPYGHIIKDFNQVLCTRTSMCTRNREGNPVNICDEYPESTECRSLNDNSNVLLIGCYDEKTCGGNVLPPTSSSPKRKKKSLQKKWNSFYKHRSWIFWIFILVWILLVVFVVWKTKPTQKRLSLTQKPPKKSQLRKPSKSSSPK